MIYDEEQFVLPRLISPKPLLARKGLSKERRVQLAEQELLVHNTFDIYVLIKVQYVSTLTTDFKSRVRVIMLNATFNNILTLSVVGIYVGLLD
jgi:hypothetical protein